MVFTENVQSKKLKYLARLDEMGLLLIKKTFL